MDEAIKAEIERLHDEDRRQNKRLEMLEGLEQQVTDMQLALTEMYETML